MRKKYLISDWSSCPTTCTKPDLLIKLGEQHSRFRELSRPLPFSLAIIANSSWNCRIWKAVQGSRLFCGEASPSGSLVGMAADGQRIRVWMAKKICHEISRPPLLCKPSLLLLNSYWALSIVEKLWCTDKLILYVPSPMWMGWRWDLKQCLLSQLCPICQ